MLVSHFGCLQALFLILRLPRQQHSRGGETDAAHHEGLYAQEICEHSRGGGKDEACHEDLYAQGKCGPARGQSRRDMHHSGPLRADPREGSH